MFLHLHGERRCPSVDRLKWLQMGNGEWNVAMEKYRQGSFVDFAGG